MHVCGLQKRHLCSGIITGIVCVVGFAYYSSHSTGMDNTGGSDQADRVVARVSGLTEGRAAYLACCAM